MAGKSKLTAKQAAFVREMATGKVSQTEAYRRTYNAEKMKPSCVTIEASRLMVNPNVAAALRTLMQRKDAAAVVSAVSDRDIVLNALRRFVGKALPSDMAKIRAAELLGKSCGVFAEVIEHREHRTPEQILADIDRRLQQDEAEAGMSAADDWPSDDSLDDGNEDDALLVYDDMSPITLQ